MDHVTKSYIISLSALVSSFVKKKKKIILVHNSEASMD